MKTNIVEIRGQSATTTSIAVAAGCDMQHKTVIRLVRRYQSDLEEFGLLNFQSSLNSQGSPTEYAILSEDQATYLITLFRNSDIVRSFKKALVKAFRKALDRINRDYANPPREGILTAKRQSNRPMLDALIEAREELGKPTGAVQFMSEAKLCNWALTGRFEAIDEATLSNEDAALLESIRDRNRAFILAGLGYDDRKARLFEFATRHRTRLLSYHQEQEAA